ncbi:MAG: hypothetical protein WDN44_10145 [Sphingomonas sp.]
MAALAWKPERFGYNRITIGLDHRLGGLRGGLSVTQLSEANSVLGARFSAALGGARADSMFLDLALRYDLGAAGRSADRCARAGRSPGCAAGVAGSGADPHQRLRHWISASIACSDRATASASASRSRCAWRAAGSICCCRATGIMPPPASASGTPRASTSPPRAASWISRRAMRCPLWGGDLSGNLFSAARSPAISPRSRPTRAAR